MFTRNLFIIATTTNVKDVKVVDVFDCQIYTLDSIIKMMEKRLNNQRYQVTKLTSDTAYIDVVNEENELLQTYSIVKKQTFLTNKKWD